MDRLLSDDSMVLVELQSHLHEKQARFSVFDVSFLADMVRKHRDTVDELALPSVPAQKAGLITGVGAFVVATRSSNNKSTDSLNQLHVQETLNVVFQTLQVFS